MHQISIFSNILESSHLTQLSFFSHGTHKATYGFSSSLTYEANLDFALSFFVLRNRAPHFPHRLIFKCAEGHGVVFAPCTFCLLLQPFYHNTTATDSPNKCFITPKTSFSESLLPNIWHLFMLRFKKRRTTHSLTPYSRYTYLFYVV